MAFNSAELKKLVEDAWERGISISASDAGRLFQRGELRDALEGATRAHSSYLQAWSSYLTAIEDEKRARANLETKTVERNAALAETDSYRDIAGYYYETIRHYYVYKDEVERRTQDLDKLLDEINRKKAEKEEHESRIPQLLKDLKWAQEIYAIAKDARDSWRRELSHWKREIRACPLVGGPPGVDCSEVWRNYYRANECYRSAWRNFNSAKKRLNDKEASLEYRQFRSEGIIAEIVELEDQLHELQKQITAHGPTYMSLAELEAEYEKYKTLQNDAVGRYNKLRARVDTLTSYLVMAENSLRSATNRWKDARREYKDAKDRWDWSPSEPEQPQPEPSPPPPAEPEPTPPEPEPVPVPVPPSDEPRLVVPEVPIAIKRKIAALRKRIVAQKRVVADWTSRLETCISCYGADSTQCRLAKDALDVAKFVYNSLRGQLETLLHPSPPPVYE